METLVVQRITLNEEGVNKSSICLEEMTQEDKFQPLLPLDDKFDCPTVQDDKSGPPGRKSESKTNSALDTPKLPNNLPPPLLKHSNMRNINNGAILESHDSECNDDASPH